MTTIDVFSSDAFNTFSMASAIEKVPHQPQFLGSLGIFAPRPIRTESFAIEERSGTLSLVPTSERGTPPQQRTNEKRSVRNFRTVRIAKADTIRAAELANIRAFGTESELMQVQAEVTRRLAGPTGLRADIELTWEHMRLGAIQGEVTDADGSTLIDWFSEFGVSKPSEIAFDFSNADNGDVKKKANQVIRQMSRAAEGAMTPGTRVYALCGDDFYDDLTQMQEVRETYLNTTPGQAERLRNEVGQAFDAVEYGNIVWVNYRGTDDNSKVAVDSDKARFFPVGAPGVFEVVWSPGEDFESLGAEGMPLYPVTVPDRDRNQWVSLELYSYPMFVCRRPRMLQSGRRGS
ncbi:MAG: major capsid protein [Halorhodospira sp.]